MEDLSLEELQAKFREVQSIETAYKLSERNVVEIMLKLMQLGLVDLIFTQSGKEYITPKQLEREIQDELLLHRGRINIVDLQPLLNVDLSVIEKKVNELIKTDKKLKLIEGELIASYYLHGIAEEINETLQTNGELKIYDLVKRFNFSGEHLQSLIIKYTGTVIQGHLDNDTLYTDAFVQRHTARIRGVFSAITKPTSISAMISEYKFKERLFMTALEELIGTGRLHGELQGRTYVPHIFDKARQQYIDNFFQQNKFIEYATLEKLFYPNPKQWLDAKYKGIGLSSHYIDRSVLQVIDGTVEDTIRGETWVDISPLVPSVLGGSDVGKLVENCPVMQKEAKLNNVVLLNEVYVVSKGFLERCIKLYEGYIKEKAEKGLLPKPEEKEEEEEQGKKKGGKKPAAKPKKKEEKPETDKELVSQFQKWMEDLPEDLIDAILLHLRSKFASMREEAARALFIGTNPETKHKTNTIIDELNTLYANIQLFEKGLQTIEDEVLEKHLLKTLCTDLVNRILQIQAMQSHLKIDKVTNASEQTQVLNQLPSQLSKTLQKLVSSLNGKSVKVFLGELDVVANKCELMLRNLDKKQERNLLMMHRQTFMDQLTTETNPAAVFHLVVVVLYLKKFGVVVHAAGRSVPVIFNKLKESLAPEVVEKLNAMQTLVIKFLTAPDDETKASLNKMLPSIKELVLGKEENEPAGASAKEERKSTKEKEPVTEAPQEEKKAPARRKARRDDD